jgi:hypothetical protein
LLFQLDFFYLAAVSVISFVLPGFVVWILGAGWDSEGADFCRGMGLLDAGFAFLAYLAYSWVAQNSKSDVLKVLGVMHALTAFWLLFSWFYGTLGRKKKEREERKKEN